MYLFSAVWNKNTLGADEISDLNGLDRSRARIEQLQKAVRQANTAIRNYAADEGLPRNQCLTVFAAPEYFFARKPSMSTRFVEQGEKQYVVNALRKLSEECENVLLVPGTVPWWRKAVQGRKDATRHAKISARITNAQGYAFSDDNFLNAVGWSHVSPGRNTHQGANWEPLPDTPGRPVQLLTAPDAYIASNTAYIALNGTVLKYHKIGNFREVHGEQGTVVFAPGNQYGFFTVTSSTRTLDGALEICRDHAIGVFHQSTIPVDVHVIVSATVETDYRFVATKAGTVIIHADSHYAATQTESLPPTVISNDDIPSGTPDVDITRADMFGGAAPPPLTRAAQARVAGERFTLTSTHLDVASAAR